MRYCHVALPRPLRQTFVYELPPGLRGAARPGARVLVPFRDRTLVGCIDRLSDDTDLSRVRPVEDLLDEEPLLPGPLLDLCRWIAHYYVAPPGMVLRTALPPGLLTESSYRIALTEAGEEDGPGAGGREEGDAAPAVLER
ncbi:MAG: primosomal protein N', partial [Gemmatimonadota bacterium]